MQEQCGSCDGAVTYRNLALEQAAVILLDDDTEDEGDDDNKDFVNDDTEEEVEDVSQYLEPIMNKSLTL